MTTDNSNQPECFFAVPSRRLRMWVSVSSEPQPYAVLERAAVEEEQVFSPTRTTPVPQPIAHLGRRVLVSGGGARAGHRAVQ
ncbi:MAG: hypothetical protein ACR2NR_22450 [Solirubrobacteraceae bacterium]